METPRSSNEGSLPLAGEMRVDAVCVRFEAAWKLGGVPRIDDFLGAATGAERAALLKELVRLDVAYRRRRGQTVSSADYLRRFPELDAAWLDREMAPVTLAEAARPPSLAETLPHARPSAGAAIQVPGYEVLGELGRGGMGVVYLARNVLMDRREVLKVVNRALLDRPGVAERFLREIRSAAMLRHNNVVQAYSAVQAGESLLFAMEYVDGEDLEKVVQRQGPLPIPYACHYVSQAAMGLQHAHEQKLVHRDIKPQNLILSRQGKKHVVKVLDFGLAKAKREGEATTELTGFGATMGTPAYMAPEQAQDAASADIRADIYSLGCTLYFLLTGAPPFSGKSLFEILRAHESATPTPLSRLCAAAPAELEAVAAKMMAKGPARRFQKPIDVAQALAVFIKPGSQPKGGKSEPPGAPTTADPAEARKGSGPVPVVPPARPDAAPARAAAKEVRDQRPPVNRPPRNDVIWSEVDGVWCAAPLLGRAARGEGGAAAAMKPVGRGPVRPAAGKGPKRWWIAAAVGVVLLLAGLAALWAAGAFGGKTPESTIPTDPISLPAPPLAVAPFNTTEAKRSQQAWADHLGVPVVRQVDLGGGATMKLVLIPPGSFQMGSPDSYKDAEADEKPQHRATITKPFYLGLYPVTKGQFAAFVKDDGYRTEAESDGKGGAGWDAEKSDFVQDPKYTWRGPGFAQTDDDPVVDVTWNDAQKFCAWLSKKEGKTYELPTEAEWEHACRAGTTTAFSFGDDPKDLGAYAWYFDDPGIGTHPVGVRKPNPWGLYDMHGNVYQWCRDYYGPYSDNAVVDPLNTLQGSEGDRVLRGGSWVGRAEHCGSAFRFRGAPDARDVHLGCRVALRLD